VLLSSAREILLGLRSDTLRWECPGGKVEDESLLAASLREQTEETGVGLLGNFILLGYAEGHKLGGSQRFLELYLLWQSWDGFAQLKEENNLQWRWFPVDKLPPAETMMPGLGHFAAALLPNYLAAFAAGEESEVNCAT
jgi:8-oxo-dGTP pyrophosphatase MutT (NUDIX family)